LLRHEARHNKAAAPDSRLTNRSLFGRLAGEPPPLAKRNLIRRTRLDKMFSCQWYSNTKAIGFSSILMKDLQENRYIFTSARAML
jgi:hypothetical protein